MEEEEIGKWHTRGYLPHYESSHVIQMVTFRLADSLPKHIAERLAEEVGTAQGNAAYRKRIESYLDAGHGACLLKDPLAARTVEDSLRFFDRKRYELYAWVIMPNHVHALVRMLASHTLGDAVRGWKSFTARKINEHLGHEGSVWQEDYWDRYIRNERYYEQAVAYIHENPTKAGLASCIEDWPSSSGRLGARTSSSAPDACEDTRAPGDRRS